VDSGSQGVDSGPQKGGFRATGGGFRATSRWKRFRQHILVLTAAVCGIARRRWIQGHRRVDSWPQGVDSGPHRAGNISGNGYVYPHCRRVWYRS
jgi:hypothetical protein